MKFFRTFAVPAVILASCLAPLAVWLQHDAAAGARGEAVTVAADEEIPNLPGKRLISLVVDYAPGGDTGPHRHAPSAFIYAYVLSGEVRSGVDDEPPRIYRAGEGWIEQPGAHHRESANASDTEPARLLAIFIVDAGDRELVIPDPH